MDKEKEIKVSFEYIGEDEIDDNIQSDDNKINAFILNYLFQDENLRNEYQGNSKITAVDVIDDISNINIENAANIYKNIINIFQENLKNTSDAYWLTEPFISIFEERENFFFLDYLKKFPDFANNLFSDTIYLANNLIDMLGIYISRNDLDSLKFFINLIIRNKEYETNSECMDFEEIKDRLLYFCEANKNEDIIKYLKEL